MIVGGIHVGGKINLRTDGYERVYVIERGLICVHRLVMEALLRRFLFRWEIVHHLDGNRQNNDIENLQILTPREHRQVHWLVSMGWLPLGEKYRRSKREKAILVAARQHRCEPNRLPPEVMATLPPENRRRWTWLSRVKRQQASPGPRRPERGGVAG